MAWSMDKLFTRDDGSPLHFYIPPFEKKEQYVKLIARGGGQILKSWNPNAIALVEPPVDTSILGDVEIFEIRWLIDSWKAGELQDLQDYRTNQRGDSFSPSKRLKYTEEESEAILEYIAGSSETPNGSKLWKVQSMFLRHSFYLGNGGE